MSFLEQQMKTLARQAGGSHKTVHDRMALVQRLCECLLAQTDVCLSMLDVELEMDSSFWKL